MKKPFIILLFHLASFTGFAQNADSTKTDHEVYSIVETMPEYEGGEAALFQWIQKETNYPQEARDKGIEGVVYVKYIVEKDGSVVEVEVVRGAHELLDAEAVRVVKTFKDYTPGTQRGKAVRVQFVLPIRFNLDKKAKKRKKRVKG